LSPSCSHVAPPPAISTLSLHDALPICSNAASSLRRSTRRIPRDPLPERGLTIAGSSTASGSNAPSTTTVHGAIDPDAVELPAIRSEEHTSELQSLTNLVCRLLLEKTQY